MTSNTSIIATKKFSIDLTKKQLELIQQDFLEEMEKELSVIRKRRK